jgi:hypothetical protein
MKENMPSYGSAPSALSLVTQVITALQNGGLDALVQNKTFLHGLFLYGVENYGVGKNGALSGAFAALATLADSAAPMLFARLIFQAHCLGGLTAMMSVAGGYAKNIRQLIISQFLLHPVTSSFNQIKADTGVATQIHDGLLSGLADVLQTLSGMKGLAGMLKKGRETFDLRTEKPPDPMPEDPPESLLIDGLLWGVPFPSGHSCYSPTCHRVFGAIGEVYLHENLDQDTHDFLGLMAGEMATLPFEQLGAMMSQGVAVDAKGSRATYMDSARNFTMPVLLFSGGLNQLVTPDTTLRTYRWLLEGNPGSGNRIQRKVYDGFGHLDCFIGRDASQKIFGDLVAYFDQLAD